MRPELPVELSLVALPGLLKMIVVFTSVLYALAVNLLFGGLVMVVVSSFRGFSEPQHRQFAGRVGRLLPVLAVIAIVLGLASHYVLSLPYSELFFHPMANSGSAGFLHFLVGALGLAGLGGAWLARSRRAKTPESAAWAERYSRLWFHAAIGCELLIGCWYLFSLPREVRGMFLGDSRLGAVLIIAAIVLAIAGIILARRSLALATIAIIISLALMVIMRQMIGLYYPGNMGKMRMERDLGTSPYGSVEVLSQEVSCVGS